MNVNLNRHLHKNRFTIRFGQLNNQHNAETNRKFNPLHLSSLRNYSVFSFYDNYINPNDEPIQSKWTIVRRRLPEILALSPTYRPKSVRAQLVLLIALMRRQSNQTYQTRPNELNMELLPLSLPQTVMINIDDHERLIHLNHIPPQQMIHVDIDGLSFSIPTRQFIIAISRGENLQTATKFCPPAMTDMLVKLSKTKVVHDGKQHRRVIVRMRIGKILFFALFTFIIGMLFILILSITNVLLQSG